MTKLCALLAVVAGANLAFAQIDGVREADYGAPLAVQSVNTNFGDSNLNQVGYANGSELNAAFCRTSGTDLNLMLTGNLESNFNKLEIFFDFRAGGVNRLDGSIPGAGALNGLNFDSDFNADLWVSITCGGGTFACYVNAWDLAGGAPSDYLGTNGGTGALSGGNNWLSMALGLNNSNTGGVGGGTGAADDMAARGVNTGVELSIPLAVFGGSVNDVKVSTFINGSSHDFVSNQILGGLASGTGNLGNPSGVDFRQYAGNQYFTLPTPGAAALLGLGGLVAGRRRR